MVQLAFVGVGEGVAEGFGEDFGEGAGRNGDGETAAAWLDVELQPVAITLTVMRLARNIRLVVTWHTPGSGKQGLVDGGLIDQGT